MDVATSKALAARAKRRRGLEIGLAGEGEEDSDQSRLIAASAGGHEAIVRLLLSRGHASVRWARADGKTALVAACGGGHTPCAAALLEAGADANHAEEEEKADGRFGILWLALAQAHGGDKEERRVDDGDAEAERP